MRTGYSLLAGMKRSAAAAGVCLAVVGAGIGLAGPAQAAGAGAAGTVKSAALSGVSCVRPTWCMAVGSTFGAHGALQDLAEVWNGTSWRLVASPPGTGLAGVSCSATWYCLAIGDQGKGHFTPAFQWNGRRWQTIAEPRSASSTPTCASRNNCFVGNSFAQSVLSWNGKTWTNTQLCGGTATARCVTSTSCANASLCMTVGSVENEIYNINASASVWDGKHWSSALPPDGYEEGVDSSQDQVSCAGQSCLAIGTTDYEWDNTAKTWQNVTPDNGVNPYGRALSCSSGTDCMAVSSDHGNPWWHAGTWSYTKFAPSGKNSVYVAVSCKSGSCVGVGGQDIAGQRTPIAELWDGAAWKLIAPKAPVS
jgi:hypothetical protein